MSLDYFRLVTVHVCLFKSLMMEYNTLVSKHLQWFYRHLFRSDFNLRKIYIYMTGVDYVYINYILTDIYFYEFFFKCIVPR